MIWRCSLARSTVAEVSTVSAVALKPTHVPAKRLMARPSRPYSTNSWTEAGARKGTKAA